MKIAVRSRSRRRSRKRLSTCAWIDTSSEATGSSQNQEVRLHGERPRDRDALSLAARELVREAAAIAGIEADTGEPSRHIAVRVARLDDPVRDRTFGHRVADAHARVEARERILMHHLDAGRELLDAPAEIPRDGRVVEQHRAGARRMDAGDDAPEGGLAAAGFADEAQHLAAADVEADVVDGAHDFGRGSCAEHPRDAIAEAWALREAL